MGWNRFAQGLGNFRNALLPIPEEVASQLDPRTLEALRRQAILQMGLGMMGAAEKGAGLGTGTMVGLNQAQQGLGQGVNQAWLGKRASREDERLDLYDQRQQELISRQERLDARQAEQDRLAEEWRRRNFEADEAYRKAQLGNTGADNRRAEEALRLTREAAERERNVQRRIAELTKKQNEYLQRGGKRNDAAWTIYQDAIKNLSGQSVTTGSSDGYELDGGGTLAPDLTALAADEAPVQRPPPPRSASPTAAAPTAASGRPFGDWAYADPNAAVAAGLGRAGRAVAPDDSYTGRLNQRIAAKLQGISWEEWRARNGLPPL